MSAAAALLLSVHPGLTPAQVLARLRVTATRFPNGSTCTVARCGAGIVNAGDLLGARRLFVGVVRPRIAGVAAVGRILIAHTGSWVPVARTVQYRWMRDGRPVAAATHRTYRLRRADAGHRLAVRVTVLRSGTRPDTWTSAQKHVRAPA